MPQENFDYNSLVVHLTALLDQERAAARTERGLVVANGKEEIAAHRARQAEIKSLWTQLQRPYERLKSRVDALPTLPPDEQITWAKSVLEMASLRLLEVDTNSIGSNLQVIRVALSDGKGNVLFDQKIALPEGAHVSEGATNHNCLTEADLVGAPSIQDAWPRILAAFSGSYLVSFAHEWDVKTLKAAAEEYKLPMPAFIGEDLQRHCTAYYLREYYLDLSAVAARMGHPLASYDALDRLNAQAAIISGMANGLVDMRQPEEPAEESDSAANGGETGNMNDDGLGDLDDHPF